MRSLLKQNRGAFELSMTTVVIIVIAMTMLILGLTLVRKIMTFGTGIIDITEKSTRDKLNKLLGEEGKTLAILLPAGEAVTKPGGEDFNAPLIAKVPGGGLASEERMSYEVSFKEDGDCVKKNSKKAVIDFFIDPIEKFHEFDEWEGDTAYASILMEVPSGTVHCTQKIYVDVKTEGRTDVRRTYFTLKIASGGLF